MRSIATSTTAGNTVTSVYNASSSTIGAGLPVMLDRSSTNVLGVKLCAAPGALSDFVGVTQNSIAAGQTCNAVVSGGHTYAAVLASATTTATRPTYLYPATISGSTYFKESSTPTSITLREDISASSGSVVTAAIYIAEEIDPRRERQRHDIWPNPAVATVAAVHAAITGSSSVAITTTTAFTNPDYPRILAITPAGTTADVAAGDYVITGTDVYGATITDTITIAANASTQQLGTKAFKTVTSLLIPIQDGAAATFSLDTTAKLGLYQPIRHIILGKAAALGGTVEGTLPTLVAATAPGTAATVSAAAASLNSALNSTQTDIYYYA